MSNELNGMRCALIGSGDKHDKPTGVQTHSLPWAGSAIQ